MQDCCQERPRPENRTCDPQTLTAFSGGAEENYIHCDKISFENILGSEITDPGGPAWAMRLSAWVNKQWRICKMKQKLILKWVGDTLSKPKTNWIQKKFYLCLAHMASFEIPKILFSHDPTQNASPPFSQVFLGRENKEFQVLRFQQRWAVLINNARQHQFANGSIILTVYTSGVRDNNPGKAQDIQFLSSNKPSRKILSLSSWWKED